MGKEKSKFKELEDDVYIKLDRMKQLMDRRFNENQKLLEKLEVEVDTIKTDVEHFRKTMESLRNVKFENLHRDMESLKTKLEWIEQTIENLDHEPLMEKIREMEHSMKILKASTPIVIE